MTHDPKGLYLHLGAHRTGTSSFQEFLMLNRGRFSDHGINLAVSNRDGSQRSSLKLRLPDRRHFKNGNTRQHETWVKGQIEANQVNTRPRTLISEENLAGTINTLFSDAIYPIAADRLEFLTRHFKRPVQRVLFGIRSYDEFFISAYRKRLEFRAVGPFSQYVPQTLTMRRSWVDVLRDIHAATGADQVVVYRYEHLHSQADLACSLFPSLPRDGWRTAPDRVNRSATNAACHAIQKAFHDGHDLTKAQIAEIKARHADDTSAEPIAEYSEFDAKLLQRRYQADADAVAALPFVHMIAPRFDAPQAVPLAKAETPGARAVGLP